MKILLVGNYAFDGSTSMHIWSAVLYRELSSRGFDVRLISPKPVLGRLVKSPVGLGKWLGYCDRYLIFPSVLRRAVAESAVVHLCDHGSSIYTKYTGKTPVVVTCHDMLAVRGALGEVSDFQTSITGRILQKLICKGLRRATKVVCVSQATWNDAARILKEDGNLQIIWNALNYPFQTLERSEANRRLAGISGLDGEYVLHVGSNHKRKNREAVIRVFARAFRTSKLQLVFAGEALNGDLRRLALNLGVNDQIVQVVQPEVQIIEALYCRAMALLFPSRYEGFGWPPIEAQACGCPVVSSDIQPIADILRDSAIIKGLEDETGMAEALQHLARDRDYRDELVARGFENVRSRFETRRMIDEYVDLYRSFAFNL